jgi:Fur family transcriptional regulator, ferric uptake regulator
MTDAPPTLKDRCRAAGLRMTGQRLVILDMLDQAQDHPDADELYRRVTDVIPTLNRATVYRTLSLLADHGLIERHRFSGGGRARYEAQSGQHHDHLIDVETGAVLEFHSPEIEALQADIARRHGFEIVSHHHDIYVKKRP